VTNTISDKRYRGHEKYQNTLFFNSCYDIKQAHAVYFVVVKENIFR